MDETLDAFLCTVQWCLLCELVSNEAFKNHDSGDDFVSMPRLMSLKLKNDNSTFSEYITHRLGASLVFIKLTTSLTYKDLSDICITRYQ